MAKKSVDIKGYTDLQQAISKAAEDLEAARIFAEGLLSAATAVVDEAKERMRQHSMRTEFRPKTIHKALPNGKYSITFNDAVYFYGLRPNATKLDDGDPLYYWGSSEQAVDVFVPTLHLALLQCVLHYLDHPTTEAVTIPNKEN